MKLNQKRRAKRRLPARVKTPLDSPSLPNHTWSFDFMSDTLYSGHRYRVLNIIDEGTREALDISIATSLPAGRVVRALAALVAEHSKPNQNAYIERFNRSFTSPVSSGRISGTFLMRRSKTVMIELQK